MCHVGYLREMDCFLRGHRWKNLCRHMIFRQRESQGALDDEGSIFARLVGKFLMRWLPLFMVVSSFVLLLRKMCNSYFVVPNNTQAETFVLHFFVLNGKCFCKKYLKLIHYTIYLGKYGHIGILYIRGSIYPKEYLIAILGVCCTIVGIT